MGNFLSGFVPEDASSYRNKAEEQAKIRNQYYEASKTAYANRDGAKAKELSLLGKAADVEMKRNNEKAAALIFRANNHLRTDREIDLHGLYVSEALKFVREAINRSKSRGDKDLVIITGIGNHSSGNLPKIRPAVIDLMQEHNLVLLANKPNNGCITIQFADKPGGLRALLKMFADPCTIM